MSTNAESESEEQAVISQWISKNSETIWLC